MNTKNILIILTIIHNLYTETPKLTCLPQKPFQADINCGDFNDVCVKKDDLLCNNFQAACKQCPPTNYTVSMLLHLNDQLNRSNLNQNEIKMLLNKIVKKSTDQVGIGAACLIFILLNFSFYIFVFLKDICCKKKKRREETWEASQCLSNNEQIIYLEEKIETMINTKIKVFEKINNEKEYSGLKSVASYKLIFRIANQFDETELFVSKFDNVIKLKKSICDRNMNMNDYKKMIMKYKDVTLDNNQFLLSCIDSTNIPIFCEFDNNVDVNAMIVIKLKYDNIYSEMIQIWKHQQIKDLKIIISKLNKTNHKDLLIFYKSTELDDDDKTTDDYKIEDNDWLIALNKFDETQNISMKSIFTEKETISIEFSKFETVSSIIKKSIKKIQQKMVTNHFVLFLNNKLLQNDKFIYEYNIDSKSLVEFCYYKNMDNIRNISRLNNFIHINFSKATYRYEGIDKPILLKAYNKSIMEQEYDNDLSMILRKELEMFQVTKSHSRFIQLNGIYMNHDCIYIGMENFIQKQMKTFLSSNNEIPIYEKSKWANQMLEGLKHLHNHNIIMKDMNPMNIWIDGNRDVKLSSFNLTDYLNCLGDNKSDKYKYKHKDSILTYVAPEILERKHYETSVDVWSLGVIMIEVVTRAQLFPKLSESEIIKKITKTKRIEYDKTNKPVDVINFIDNCVKVDPKERATIDQLMKHKFIEKYLL